MNLQINDRVRIIPAGYCATIVDIVDDLYCVRPDGAGDEKDDIVTADSLEPEGDDLSIPWFMSVRNPAVIAGRQAARAMPVTVAHFEATQHRDLDAETKAFMDAEAERVKAKGQNSLGKFKAKTAAKVEIAKGGRWDSTRNIWLSPEQDYAERARRIGMTAEQCLVHTKACALLDPGKTDCIANQARKTLAALNESKLAVEGEKAERRAKAALKRLEKISAAPLKTSKRRSI